MQIDILFDPLKDALNRSRHGVSLELAHRIDWREVMSAVDDRKDYGELREIGYAPVESRLYCVVFTQRGAALRIISVRRANNREVDRYERSIEKIGAEHAGGRSRDPARHPVRSGNVRPFRRPVRDHDTADRPSAE
ncbi:MULTISPECIES: BrnT family toxin [unclassified Caballeronia]|uniref:BrnT family toxin n=1 Tax=unclassified Caballeronia TaxID=2646786 RepID=UPI00285B4FDF|nr:MULTISPECIES: BrnT family toxin [unclassified Caballeronia]MDR5739769.1 BrnT family toxin [Caballeronia sp. LZ016]MDR5808234.1 BrnT family toxin [Caballeronia sp. LZ019]